MTLSAKDFAPPPPTAGSGHYVYPPDLVRAVKVAMVTQRPLLLRGAPGCGKTTLAADLARQLGRVFLQQVVTSRTEARDLEWQFDAIRRLSDAQLATPAMRKQVADVARYVDPQVLWWGFDPASARTRGGAAAGAPPRIPEAARAVKTDKLAAVVLIDEIDKAEPELANDLLEPFDRGGFTVAETGFEVSRVRSDVFLVVTTNEARDLPGPFLRRCVAFELERPLAKQLAAIAEAHHGTGIAALVDLDAISRELDRLAGIARDRGLREPGTAEFLDTVTACKDLALTADSDEWKAMTRLTLWKHARKELG
ncbi:MAG TPA: MoxR family ATPase [Kofleriaceae bacterium]|jgi:MoxR-like ATPase